MGNVIARHLEYKVSEGKKFGGDTTLRVVQCYSCGITYTIPESLYQSLREYRGDTPNGWKTVCPMGHEWWFVGETDEDRLKRQLQASRDRAGRLASDLEQTEARRVAQKAATTRARRERNRIAERVRNGVCPCCNRSFKNVRLHMTKMHPGFDPAKGDD